MTNLYLFTKKVKILRFSVNYLKILLKNKRNP